MITRSLVLLAFTISLGCVIEDGSGDGTAEATRVFAVPKSASPNGASLLGVWETTAPQKNSGLSSTTRLEIASDHLVVATRCSEDDGSAQPVTVGVHVDAQVDASSIVVNQPGESSARIGTNGQCGVGISQGTIPTCSGSQTTSCFTLASGQLTIALSAGPQVFGKVSD